MNKSKRLAKSDTRQSSSKSSSLHKTETLEKDRKSKTERGEVRQFSVHLRASTHRATKIALLMQGGKQDFSGLVEELLIEYLSKQNLQISVQEETV
jgi:hypothetical protein